MCYCVKTQWFGCQYSLINYLELCNQLFNSNRIVKTKIADVQNGQIRLFSSIHDPRASRRQLSQVPCRLPLLTKDKKLRFLEISYRKVGVFVCLNGRLKRTIFVSIPVGFQLHVLSICLFYGRYLWSLCILMSVVKFIALPFPTRCWQMIRNQGF